MCALSVVAKVSGPSIPLVLAGALSPVVFLAREADEIFFKRIDGKHVDFAVVTRLFHEVIEPLYGNQTGALQKIASGKDRECQLMYCGREVVGLMVYKIVPSDELSRHGVTNSLELKTFFLVDPKQNSGKGLGTKMFRQLEKTARQRCFPYIHVTVSEEKPESFQFFEKRGFTVLETWDGKYKQGIHEHLMGKRV